MAPSLHTRLSRAAALRTSLESQLSSVRRETAKLLLEVKDSNDIGMTEASRILSLSKPTVYILLHDAEGAQ